MAKHCSVIKGEILLYATRMELDNTILSKISQSQKNNIKCSHFHVEAKKLISKMQRIKWWLPRPGESMKEEKKKKRRQLADTRRGEITFCLSFLLYNDKKF